MKNIIEGFFGKINQFMYFQRIILYWIWLQKIRSRFRLHKSWIPLQRCLDHCKKDSFEGNADLDLLQTNPGFFLQITPIFRKQFWSHIENEASKIEIFSRLFKRSVLVTALNITLLHYLYVYHSYKIISLLKNIGSCLLKIVNFSGFMKNTNSPIWKIRKNEKFTSIKTYGEKLWSGEKS